MVVLGGGMLVFGVGWVVCVDVVIDLVVVFGYVVCLLSCVDYLVVGVGVVDGGGVGVVVGCFVCVVMVDVVVIFFLMLCLMVCFWMMLVRLRFVVEWMLLNIECSVFVLLVLMMFEVLFFLELLMIEMLLIVV